MTMHLTRQAAPGRAPHARTLLLLLLLVAAPAAVRSSPPPQGGDAGYRAERERALKLYEANNFAEAQPLLEKLAAANPSDVVVLEALGYSTLANSTVIKDPEARKRQREKARAALLRAKELGDDSNLLRYALDALDSPDAADIPFSALREAEQAMREGEELFAKGQLDKAIEAYQRALNLDPRLYSAALFIGDSYYKKREHDKAGEWFARAVQINPDIETAHRYWGDALMAQGKRREARDRFVEAIVAEPYNQSPRVGLSQWGQRYGLALAHPRIDIPTDVKTNADGSTTVNISPEMLLGGAKDDGSSAWLVYGITRAAWSKEKFAREFPRERAYRHTLREEAEALEAVASLVRAQSKEKKIKQLNPSLANLLKLSDAGLVEAYVLFARPDRGIAQDYAEYRKANRDKLRRYWIEFVIPGD